MNNKEFEEYYSIKFSELEIGDFFIPFERRHERGCDVFRKSGNESGFYWAEDGSQKESSEFLLETRVIKINIPDHFITGGIKP